MNGPNATIYGREVADRFEGWYRDVIPMVVDMAHRQLEEQTA